MPKHNSQHINNLKTDLGIMEPVYRGVDPTTPITSLRDAKVRVTGKYSGQEYLFLGAGSVINVNNKDVEWILSLRQGKACCGGGGGNALFELAGEL